MFNLIAVVTAGAFILALFLPRSIEQKRENVAPSSLLVTSAAVEEVEPVSSNVQLLPVLAVPHSNQVTEDKQDNGNVAQLNTIDHI